MDIPQRQLILTRGDDDSDAQYIVKQLETFNHSIAPTAQEPSSETVNFVLKDSEGRIFGGLLGRVYRFAFFVHILWVSEELRGQGYGSKLLEEAEAIAREKGCGLIHLDTWNFQAPEFYKKHGFEVFGILEGFPEGFKRYFLRKSLTR